MNIFLKAISVLKQNSVNKIKKKQKQKARREMVSAGLLMF